MKILIIIAILVIFYLQFKEINNYTDSYDILQSDNPKKEKFEEVLGRKCITVFTDVVKDLEEIKKLKFSELQKMDAENKKKLQSVLYEHFQYYFIPLCLTYNFSLDVENKGFKSHIIKSSSYRNLFCQIDGKKKLILFNREQQKYLYVKNKKSQIDFWDQDLKKFPLISKSKFIEILVSPGQMIYIPPGWWYCYENLEDSIIVQCTSESFFSFFLNFS
jgi:hypothetical protein